MFKLTFTTSMFKPHPKKASTPKFANAKLPILATICSMVMYDKLYSILFCSRDLLYGILQKDFFKISKLHWPWFHHGTIMVHGTTVLICVRNCVNKIQNSTTNGRNPFVLNKSLARPRIFLLFFVERVIHLEALLVESVYRYWDWFLPHARPPSQSMDRIDTSQNSESY